METIHAPYFVRSLPGGSSRPVVAQDDGGRSYLVKTRGSGQGIRGLLYEALATGLAGELGLPVLECKEVILDGEFGAGVLDAELRETLAASTGSNLGFDFLEGATPFNLKNLTDLDINLRDDLFLYDLLLLNVDRTPTNPNLIVHQGEVISIDYGACMRLLASGDLSSPASGRALAALRTHPFYRDGIDTADFVNKLGAIGRDTIGSLVRKVPLAWFADGERENAEAERARFENRMSEIVADASGLNHSLDSLRDRHVETKQSRKQKAMENRIRFKAEMG